MFTSPNEPGSGANWIAFCVIQSKSSNISRHQIFTEGDTAQVRQSHSGRQDRASLSSGSLWSSREEVQKTPTIIMQGAKCSAGGGHVLERTCRHRRISLPGPGNSPSMYKPGAESYLSLSYKLVINIHEDLRNCVLPYAEWQNSGWVPICVHGLLRPFWDCDLLNSHTFCLHGHPKPAHCLR